MRQDHGPFAYPPRRPAPRFFDLGGALLALIIIACVGTILVKGIANVAAIRSQAEQHINPFN